MAKPDLSQFSKDVVDLVMGYSYMSNQFMSVAFCDHDVQQHIIRIGMNDPDIELNSTETQLRFNNIRGREITFDSISRDTNGDVYNVEVENRTERGGLERVTFHVSALDTQTVHKGLKDFRKLPKANGIMFVQGDPLHNGKQRSVFEVRDADCPDESVKTSRLKYVIINVDHCDGDDELSQLCHDLQQSDYQNIRNEHLARRMKEIKEGEEVVEMCKKEEEFGNRRYNKGKEEGRAEGRAEGDEHRARMVTMNCLEMNYSLQKIARIVERSIDVVESWAKESGLPYQVS